MMDMTITLPGGMRVEAEFRGHVVATDQLPEMGGEDSAAQPYEVFLASLGTCAGVYVRGFCKNRGIPTDGIRLIQRTELDEKTHLAKNIEIEIQVPPEFPEKYHAALVRVANKCAVKRTLAEPPEISTKTVVVG